MNRSTALMVQRGSARIADQRLNGIRDGSTVAADFTALRDDRDRLREEVRKLTAKLARYEELGVRA